MKGTRSAIVVLDDNAPTTAGPATACDKPGRSRTRWSVVIPLYNKEHIVERALRSVLDQQDAGSVEVIVVDDGSTDGSAAVVEGIDDARVRLVRQVNAGVSAARNRGLTESGGEWIVWLDADDAMLPDALAAFERMAARWPDAAVLAGGYVRLGDGQSWQPDGTQEHDHRTRCPYLAHWLGHFYPRPGAIAVRRDACNAAGGYDERMSFYEDYDYGLRVMAGRVVAWTDQAVNVYYVEPGGLSQSRHDPRREMAWYTPQMARRSVWHRALLYENLMLMLAWWRDDDEVRAHYEDMARRDFSCLDAALHWVRQKMVRHGLIKKQ